MQFLVARRWPRTADAVDAAGLGVRSVWWRYKADRRDRQLYAGGAPLLAGLGGVLGLGRRPVGEVGSAAAGVALGAADGGVHDPVPAAGVVGVDLVGEAAVLLVNVDGDADGEGFGEGGGDGGIWS